MNRQHRTVAVFGAYGHTAAFVLGELRRRGCTPLLVGRDAAKLHSAAQAHPGAQVRVASVADPTSLDRAVSGAAAVINCAGPFADTAPPVVDAALRAGIPYLDVAAEQAVTLETFQRRAHQARDAGVVVAPSMAFYGGLGDLLASAAMGDWPAADDITIAIALDNWQPTRGTRKTVRRNAGRHLVFTGNRLTPPSGCSRRGPDGLGAGPRSQLRPGQGGSARDAVRPRRDQSAVDRCLRSLLVQVHA
jgi:uncharacterized protein YbjT (DUF2867 family)